MHIEKVEESKEALNTETVLTKIDPLRDCISSVELVRVSGSDLDVVNAARVSYGKVSKVMNDRNKKLIKYLIEHQHTSPFEHNQLSFRVKTPLFVSRQWMRHRMHSYNEISYRYVQAPLEFYIPQHWRFQDATNRQCSSGAFTDQELEKRYKACIDTAFKTYETLIEQGVAREIARGVLPMCMYTEFIFTSNLHALMHFMKLRLHPGAQHEIRAYARALLELSEPHFPESLGNWRRINAALVDPTPSK